MSELGSISPADLPTVLEEFACLLGGQPYAEGAIDGVRLCKDIIGLSGRGESYVRFKALRMRKTPGSPVDDTVYAFEQGTSTSIESADLPDDLDITFVDDEEDGALWMEEVETISCFNNEVHGRVIATTQSHTYGQGEENLVTVPVIDGKAVYGELDDMHPIPEFMITSAIGGVSLLELTQKAERPAIVIPTEPFEAMVFSMMQKTGDVTSYIERMAGMMAMLKV